MAKARPALDVLDVELADENDIWRDYDPVMAGKALERLAGVWSHLDTEKMIRDIRRARTEGSRE